MLLSDTHLGDLSLVRVPRCTSRCTRRDLTRKPAADTTASLGRVVPEAVLLLSKAEHARRVTKIVTDSYGRKRSRDTKRTNYPLRPDQVVTQAFVDHQLWLEARQLSHGINDSVARQLQGLEWIRDGPRDATAISLPLNQKSDGPV